jgi:O-antigen/teichoic acid export membrane protein
MGVGFALNVCSAKLLGAGAYGSLALGLSLLSVLVIFVCLGLDQVAIKWVAWRVSAGPERHLEIICFFKKSLSLLYFFSAVSAVLGLMYLMATKDYVSSIVFAIITTPLVAVTMLNEATIRGLGYTAGSTVASQLVRPLVSISLLGLVLLDWVRPTLIAILAIYAIGIALAFQYSRSYVNQKLALLNVSENEKYQCSLPVLGLLSETKGFFAVSLASVLLNKVDILMLSALASEHDVGLYAAAYSLAFLVMVVLQVVNLVFAPNLAAAYAQKDKIKIQFLLARSRWVGGGLAAPIFLGLFFAPELFLSFMGKDFVAGVESLQILAVGMLANAMFGSVGNFLMMSGHEKLFSTIVLISVFSSILLMLWIVPLYGIVGAAFVVSGIMCAWNFFAFMATRSVIERMI